MSALSLRFFCFLVLSCPVLATAQNAGSDKIAPSLSRLFSQDGTADFLIVLREQLRPVPPAHFTQKEQKGAYVYAALQQQARSTQQRVWALLRSHGAAANAFCVVNAVSVRKGNATLAHALAAMPEVAALISDPVIHLNLLPPVSDAGVRERSIEWGVARIGAPEVWQRGYTGSGITIGGADTGYDWEHPAIRPHYRGYKGDGVAADHAYNWHDAIHTQSPLNGDANNPCGFDIKSPCDDQTHGTHTMGTMTGDDGQGNQIGVAPGAQWIGCRNMERGWGQPSTYLECFEWFLAPTDTAGLSPRPDKAPHVINNSWYCAVSEGCTDRAVDTLLEIAVTNLKRAGIFVVVSNGNAGSSCASTDGPPAYFDSSFSVGAVNSDEQVARFSSRGPVTRDGSTRIKPNVAAPGVNVRSCVPGNAYANYQGTSMAGPHVAGLVALILSARPDLAGQVEIIEDLIEQTAVFRPDTFGCTADAAARPNNVYGYGRVDAVAAIEAALLVVPVASVAPRALSVRCRPNPAREWLYLEWDGSPGAATVQIFSADGSLLFEQTLQTGGGRQRVEADARNMPQGACFWRLKTNAGTGTGTFIKM